MKQKYSEDMPVVVIGDCIRKESEADMRFDLDQSVMHNLTYPSQWQDVSQDKIQNLNL